MKIIITGSSGLVGSACVREALKRDDIHIYSIARKNNSQSNSSNISNYKSVLELPKDISYDLLIHAAAATPNNTNFEEIAEINQKIDRELCILLEEIQIKQVAYLSTMAIYGHITQSEITEQTKPNSPNMYGLSKLWGEELLSKTTGTMSTKLSILRLPGVVGKGMPRVFFKRCEEMLLGQQAITFQSNLTYSSRLFAALK